MLREISFNISRADLEKKKIFVSLPTLSLYSLLCFVNIVWPVSAIVAGLIVHDYSAYTSALVIILDGFSFLISPVDQ